VLGWSRSPASRGKGKVATEDRLIGSSLCEVIVGPDRFQEIWLSRWRSSTGRRARW
jgi:hypothetical protein